MLHQMPNACAPPSHTESVPSDSAATARIDSLQHLLASECMTSFVAAHGEYNIGSDAAWWSSVGEAGHVVPVRVPLSLIAPFSAH